jgi:bleomycin hydrolase
MGNSQSNPSDEVVQEKLVEQLTALQLNNWARQQELEKGYVKIDFEDSPPAYHEGSRTVSISEAEEWEKELLANPKNKLALSALLSNPVQSIISQRVATLSDRQTFNIKVPLEGSPVTNQRSSGRCWLFAATNVFRVAIMKKHNLKELELSQAYLFFWDKLEKANYFLEQIIDTAEEKLDSRLIQELLKAPVNDGGQWDMVVNLVAKYGLVCSFRFKIGLLSTDCDRFRKSSILTPTMR